MCASFGRSLWFVLTQGFEKPIYDHSGAHRLLAAQLRILCCCCLTEEPDRNVAVEVNRGEDYADFIPG